MAEAQVQTKPIVPFVKMPEGAPPYLAGVKCNNCGTVFAGEARKACAKCGDRTKLESVKLGEKGTLYNYTIVYRSFPGIKVPFVSVIVDLEGGGSLKGNLLGVNPIPEAIKFDMPVKVVFKEADQKDKAGNSYLAYFFEPA